MNITPRGGKSFKKDLLQDEKRLSAAVKLGTNEAREALISD